MRRNDSYGNGAISFGKLLQSWQFSIDVLSHYRQINFLIFDSAVFSVQYGTFSQKKAALLGPLEND